ncbi:hypothetical protein [Thiohalocapsa sp. ML1]|jgi:hypothetical protein|uniref:hypothetical protein n=1 Tax=Thiohalocapsa sp. ML1 TaxID=1431688 RepID=UPI0012E3823D|nr:hypothetical protein [Thiohalocapsa sp. ML1]
MSVHRRRFRGLAAALLIPGLTLLNLFGEEPFAMADPLTRFGWEWRAERALEQRAGIRLTRVKREGGGLFGIGRSPSLGGSLPDAQVVRAEVLAVDRPGQAAAGSTIEFRIPKMELKGAEAGALVAIGIIGQNVVCLAPAAAGVTADSLASWLPEAPCP